MGLFDSVRRLLGGGDGDGDGEGGGDDGTRGSGGDDGDGRGGTATAGASENGGGRGDGGADGSELRDATAAGGVAGADSGGAAGGGGDGETEPPETFAEEAAELAEFWPEHDFDYTPESLVRLDAFVDDQWDKTRFREVAASEGDGGDGVHMDQLVFRGVALQLGSYFGETLVETYEAAEWADEEEFGWAVAVDGPEAQLVSNVFHIARDCLREPSKFAASHDNVVRHAGVGEPLDPEGGDSVEIAVSVPGEEVDREDLRDMAEHLRGDYPWYDLDYELDTLSELDELVTEELFDGSQLVDEFDEEELSETVQKLGAYFGETLVRSAGGTWGRDGTWEVQFETDADVIGVDVFRAAVQAVHADAAFEALAVRVLAATNVEAEADGDADADAADVVAEAEAADVTEAPGVMETDADTGTDADAAVGANAGASAGESGTDVEDGESGGDRDESVAAAGSTTRDDGTAGVRGEAGDGGTAAAGAAPEDSDDGAAEEVWAGTALAEAAGVDLPDQSVSTARFDQWATVLADEFPDAGLDRTPESLADVDELIEGSLPAFDDLAAGDRSDLTLAVGCYLGETLRAAHEARWINREDHWVVDVTFEDGAGAEVDVFGVALQSLRSGEGALAAAYVDAATNAGGEDAGADGDPADADDAAAWATEEATEFVATWSDYELDYTPGSLSRLDELAAAEFGHLREVDEATDELLETAAGFGAYFGEVLRRHDGGTWEIDRGPTILVPAGDGDGVGVDAVQAAATCLAGNASFAGVRADLRARSQSDG